ncbi:hypothetical protein EI94DRAFT_1735605 [Lactarius quietus]|nr:hypothetical protein EI94DRAFT_1735605 [Lactarius quietus]
MQNIFGLLANILQAAITICSPPAPYPPVPSPAKAVSPARQPSATVNWRSLCKKSARLSPKVPFPSPPPIAAYVDVHMSRRPCSASCPSPRPHLWVAPVRAQAARRTLEASCINLMGRRSWK